jgi:hypothetical protein
MPTPRSQRGMTFYLFVVFTLITLGTLFTGTALVQGNPVQRDGERILSDARKAVLVYLSQPDMDAVAGRRLGEWRLFPDLPIPAGAGADVVEPSYDGLAETGGCAMRTWLPGAAVAPVAVSGGAARCFGRLPWRSLGMALPDAEDVDRAGIVPWMVLSPNLAAGVACLPNLNPLMLSVGHAGYGCPTAVPHPWLRVLDERGNLLSDRVAIALVLPGGAMDGQLRTAASGPEAWLDTVTVAPGCTLPCVPGAYGNANWAHGDGVPTTLIRAMQPGPAADRSGNYTQPYRFNDRVVYITADELFDALEARARREVTARLLETRTAVGYFPWPASLASANGECVAGESLGHPPIGCPAGAFANLPAWFTDAGWHRYFVYAVSPRCNASDPACNAPGLTVGPNTGVNALVIAPGRAILTPPYAPSKLLAQAPLLGANTSADPRDYLDSLVNASVDGVFELVPAPTPSNNDRLLIVQ